MCCIELVMQTSFIVLMCSIVGLFNFVWIILMCCLMSSAHDRLFCFAH
jgi:hypothetical protein